MLSIFSVTLAATLSAGPASDQHSFQPLTRCEPAAALSHNGVPEAQGTSGGGTLWGLFFDPLVAGNDVKIAWRVTGTGPFQIRAYSPTAESTLPKNGPTAHLGSTWNRPGDEWGTVFVFPTAGCWDLHVTRGDTSGDLWIDVHEPRNASVSRVERAGNFVDRPSVASERTPQALPTANPVSEFLRGVAAQSSQRLEDSADLMPAAKYSFKPTDAQMTFGELMAHVAQTNIALCSAVSMNPSPMSPAQLQTINGKDSKDALVRNVKLSFQYCRDAFAASSDVQLGAATEMFGRSTGQSRAAVLITLSMDWADHYSTAANYLRLNGILPPTAQPKK